MMSNHICPFCNASIPNIDETFRTIECRFTRNYVGMSPVILEKDFFQIEMLKCPTCKKISYVAVGCGKLKESKIPLFPTSLAKQFQDYVPTFIREDYEEAYSILDLSPKASATLSRRCLQGMIRDFWGITKSTLYEEISALKDKVSADQWKAIDALRSLGNIGAHMQKDVNTIVDIEPNEAEKVLKLIELLIEKWYVARHDEQELLSDIVSINEDKTSQKEQK